MRAQPGSKLLALAVILTASLVVACGDETGPDTDTVIGSWMATNLTAPTRPDWGDAITDDGLSVSVTFNNSGGYSFSVSGDDPADPWICGGTATCTYSGTYAVSGNTLVLDEGTADETSVPYTLSGDRLTLASYEVWTGDPYRVVLRRD